MKVLARNQGMEGVECGIRGDLFLEGTKEGEDKKMKNIFFIIILCYNKERAITVIIVTVVPGCSWKTYNTTEQTFTTEERYFLTLCYCYHHHRYCRHSLFLSSPLLLFGPVNTLQSNTTAHVPEKPLPSSTRQAGVEHRIPLYGRTT